MQVCALLTHNSQALRWWLCTKMLIGQRDMVSLCPSEQNWTTNESLPRTVSETGYRFGAILVVRNIFSRITIS